ncbi:MAG: RNA polymerase sigma factor [Actinomycetota bacterium]
MFGDAFTSVLEGARGGEPWALEAIYRDLAPGVLGYLRGQRAAEPEDLTSEVFVGIVRGLPTFRGQEPDFRSWVFSITHRRLLDERRRRARRREDAVDPSALAGALAATSAGDAETEALARLGEGWALRAIGVLTADQRSVLLLRVLADLSVEEVARILGKREGAVKTLQRRALASLARLLEREGVS